MGIINPVTVRHLPVGYELVAGYKRCKAAQLEGLKEIPAVVKTLNDEEVLELQIIENLHRSDVHPLDEAEGYHVLFSYAGATIEGIAAKVGKSPAYISGRLQLVNLTDELKERFRTEDITVTHALVLCRFDENIQKKSFKWMLGHGDTSTVSARRLKDHITMTYLLELKSAPFKTSDGKLDPDAGPCTSCPKRTGYNTLLFNEITTEDTCLDAKCFNNKKDLFHKNKITAAIAKHPEALQATVNYNSKKDLPYIHGSKPLDKKSPKCESEHQYIITETGPYNREELGKVYRVCDNVMCKVHAEQHREAEQEDEGYDTEDQQDEKRLTSFQFTQLKKRVVETVTSMEFNQSLLEIVLSKLFDEWNLRFDEMSELLSAYIDLPEGDPYADENIPNLAAVLINGKLNQFLLRMAFLDFHNREEIIQHAEKFGVNLDEFYEMQEPENEHD